MNNSFTQKAQHYLNESYRLTEELDAEIQYSALLEAVLEELVGTENFLALMELSSDLKGRYIQAALDGVDFSNSRLKTLSGEKADARLSWAYNNGERKRLMQPRQPGDTGNWEALFAEQEAAKNKRDAAAAAEVKIGEEEKLQHHILGRRTKGLRPATLPRAEFIDTRHTHLNGPRWIRKS